MSASSPYHQVYFYAFSRLPEPSRAGSEVIIDLRGCQSSPCLTSPPSFIAPVEPRLLVAYLAGPCFLYISRLFGVALDTKETIVLLTMFTISLRYSGFPRIITFSLTHSGKPSYN